MANDKCDDKLDEAPATEKLNGRWARDCWSPSLPSNVVDFVNLLIESHENFECDYMRLLREKQERVPRVCSCGNPANYCKDCADGDVRAARSAVAPLTDETIIAAFSAGGGDDVMPTRQPHAPLLTNEQIVWVVRRFIAGSAPQSAKALIECDNCGTKYQRYEPPCPTCSRATDRSSAK